MFDSSDLEERYWTRDVKYEAARQDEKRKTSEKGRSEGQ